MSERLLGRLRLALTIGLAVFVVVATATADPPAEDRAREIGSLIRCPTCQGESIAESPSALADDMMSLVRVRIDEGLSDQQIIDELVASYSGAQLLDPPWSLETAALWLIPALVLGIGIAAGVSRTKAGATRAAGGLGVDR
ncbi:MAG TPA: cytochrome c-type biogenesis protein CcmH [Acidimicrobiia bacterium]|nr:cytochrome c-type biogenesis protein CcmH [Acidimicrobiia bacterium]